jgi:hypothetical protein
MSLAGVKLYEGWPFPADRGIRSPPSGRRRRWHWPWWAWLVLAATVAVIATASVLAALANAYQPLSYGSDSMGGLAYPGLPAAHGIRAVNTFGGIREDLYLPPQRGVFYLFASVANEGSRAVVIEGVTVPRSGELRRAGQTRYARPGGGNGAVGIPRARRVLHNVTLGPGQEILVAIPVRSWPCTSDAFGWTYVQSFDVTYRFATFTHVAALPWGMNDDMLIMHFPAGKPGTKGVYCVR